MPSRYLNLDQLINLSFDAHETKPLPSYDLLDSVADGIFSVDTELRAISSNRALKQMTGYTRDQVIGQSCKNIFKCELCDQECSV